MQRRKDLDALVSLHDACLPRKMQVLRRPCAPFPVLAIPSVYDLRGHAVTQLDVTPAAMI